MFEPSFTTMQVVLRIIYNQFFYSIGDAIREGIEFVGNNQEQLTANIGFDVNDYEENSWPMQDPNLFQEISFQKIGFDEFRSYVEKYAHYTLSSDSEIRKYLDTITAIFTKLATALPNISKSTCSLSKFISTFQILRKCKEYEFKKHNISSRAYLSHAPTYYRIQALLKNDERPYSIQEALLVRLAIVSQEQLCWISHNFDEFLIIVKELVSIISENTKTNEDKSVLFKWLTDFSSFLSHYINDFIEFYQREMEFL